MSEVDPYTIGIPKQFLTDPEVRAWFVYDNRWKHDMWVRSGGGTDIIETITLEVASTIEPELYAYNSRVEQELKELKLSIDTAVPVVKEFRAITVTSNYTAVDHDFINAKSRAVITLPKYPVVNSVIIIRNGDGSNIKLVGNGKNINDSSDGFMRTKGAAIHFHYFIDTDEWFAR